MSHSTQPIAVFGATGAQGGPVVEALLAAGRPVRAIARNRNRLIPLRARGVDVYAVDLAEVDEMRQALGGVSAAFVHLPFIPIPSIVEAQARSVVQALRDADVSLVVFTLSGPAADAPTGVVSFDTKALAKHIFATSDLPLIGFEPVGYLGNLSAPFTAPAVVKYNELRYPLPADHRQPWISTDDQAKLAMAAFERADLVGRWFSVGEQLTGPELAAGISAVRGRQVRYVPLDPEEFGQSMVPFMGPEVGAALTADYRLLSSRAQALHIDRDTEAVRRELGVPATPISDWARTQDWEVAAGILQEL